MALQRVVAREIALDGLEGTPLDLLWTHLENASFPTDYDCRQCVWDLLVSGACGNIEFFQLPEPYPADVLANLIKNDDHRKLAAGYGGHLPPYSFCAVEDGVIRGSCPSYSKRINVTNCVRAADGQHLCSVEEATERWGAHLVMVASQEARECALMQCMDATVQLNMRQYAMLELIGRARVQGVTQHSLSQYAQVEARSCFYDLRRLASYQLITLQRFHMNQGKPQRARIYTPLALLQCFHHRVYTPSEIVGEALSRHLESMPDQRVQIGRLKWPNIASDLLRNSVYTYLVRMGYFEIIAAPSKRPARLRVNRLKQERLAQSLSQGLSQSYSCVSFDDNPSPGCSSPIGSELAGDEGSKDFADDGSLFATPLSTPNDSSHSSEEEDTLKETRPALKKTKRMVNRIPHSSVVALRQAYRATEIPSTDEYPDTTEEEPAAGTGEPVIVAEIPSLHQVYRILEAAGGKGLLTSEIRNQLFAGDRLLDKKITRLSHLNYWPPQFHVFLDEIGKSRQYCMLASVHAAGNNEYHRIKESQERRAKVSSQMKMSNHSTGRGKRKVHADDESDKDVDTTEKSLVQSDTATPMKEEGMEYAALKKRRREYNYHITPTHLRRRDFALKWFEDHKVTSVKELAIAMRHNGADGPTTIEARTVLRILEKMEEEGLCQCKKTFSSGRMLTVWVEKGFECCGELWEKRIRFLSGEEHIPRIIKSKEREVQPAEDTVEADSEPPSVAASPERVEVSEDEEISEVDSASEDETFGEKIPVAEEDLLRVKLHAKMQRYRQLHAFTYQLLYGQRSLFEGRNHGDPRYDKLLRSFPWLQAVQPLDQVTMEGSLPTCMLEDLIKNMPASLFCNLWGGINKRTDSILPYLLDDSTRHTLIKDLPKIVKSALLIPRTGQVRSSAWRSLMQLAAMNLVKVWEADGSIGKRHLDYHRVHVLKSVQLMDTTSASVGFMLISAEEAASFRTHHYTLDTIEDVQRFWYDTENICTRTKLGHYKVGSIRDGRLRDAAVAAGIPLVQPVLQGLGKKKSAEVQPYPPGCVGAGGFRPELFSHRNWTHSWERRCTSSILDDMVWTNEQPGTSEDILSTLTADDLGGMNPDILRAILGSKTKSASTDPKLVIEMSKKGPMQPEASLVIAPASKVARTGTMQIVGGLGNNTTSWLPEEPLTADQFMAISFASLPLNLEAQSTGLPNKRVMIANEADLQASGKTVLKRAYFSDKEDRFLLLNHVAVCYLRAIGCPEVSWERIQSQIQADVEGSYSKLAGSLFRRTRLLLKREEVQKMIRVSLLEFIEAMQVAVGGGAPLVMSYHEVLTRVREQYKSGFVDRQSMLPPTMEELLREHAIVEVNRLNMNIHKWMEDELTLVDIQRSVMADLIQIVLHSQLNSPSFNAFRAFCTLDRLDHLVLKSVFEHFKNEHLMKKIRNYEKNLLRAKAFPCYDGFNFTQSYHYLFRPVSLPVDHLDQLLTVVDWFQSALGKCMLEPLVLSECQPQTKSVIVQPQKRAFPRRRLEPKRLTAAFGHASALDTERCPPAKRPCLSGDILESANTLHDDNVGAMPSAESIIAQQDDDVNTMAGAELTSTPRDDDVNTMAGAEATLTPRDDDVNTMVGAESTLTPRDDDVNIMVGAESTLTPRDDDVNTMAGAESILTQQDDDLNTMAGAESTLTPRDAGDDGDDDKMAVGKLADSKYKNEAACVEVNADSDKEDDLNKTGADGDEEDYNEDRSLATASAADNVETLKPSYVSCLLDLIIAGQAGVGVELPLTLIIESKSTALENKRTKKASSAKQKTLAVIKKTATDGCESQSGSDSDDNDEDIYLNFGKVLSMDESEQVAPCQLEMFVKPSLSTSLDCSVPVNTDNHLVIHQRLNSQLWRCTGTEEVGHHLIKSGQLPSELLELSDEECSADLVVDMEKTEIRLQSEKEYEKENEAHTAYLESALPKQQLSGLSLEDHVMLCARHLGYSADDLALARFVYEAINIAGWRGVPVSEFAIMIVPEAYSNAACSPLDHVYALINFELVVYVGVKEPLVVTATHASTWLVEVPPLKGEVQAASKSSLSANPGRDQDSQTDCDADTQPTALHSLNSVETTASQLSTGSETTDFEAARSAVELDSTKCSNRSPIEMEGIDTKGADVVSEDPNECGLCQDLPKAEDAFNERGLCQDLPKAEDAFNVDWDCVVGDRSRALTIPDSALVQTVDENSPGRPSEKKPDSEASTTLHYVSQPWKALSGTPLEVVTQHMQLAVLNAVQSKPGIRKSELEEMFASVIRPFTVDNVLDVLSWSGCVEKRCIQCCRKPSLFSHPTESFFLPGTIGCSSESPASPITYYVATEHSNASFAHSIFTTLSQEDNL